MRSKTADLIMKMNRDLGDNEPFARMTFSVALKPLLPKKVDLRLMSVRRSGFQKHIGGDLPFGEEVFLLVGLKVNFKRDTRRLLHVSSENLISEV